MGHFCPPVSGSTDLIESGSNPDQKHCFCGSGLIYSWKDCPRISKYDQYRTCRINYRIAWTVFVSKFLIVQVYLFRIPFLQHCVAVLLRVNNTFFFLGNQYKSHSQLNFGHIVVQSGTSDHHPWQHTGHLQSRGWGENIRLPTYLFTSLLLPYAWII